MGMNSITFRDTKLENGVLDTMKIVAKVTGDTDVNQDFVESVRSLANKAATLQGTLQTEEATKMSLIVPMFTAMGYDVFNPNEFCPEYTADVGIKKGEKVDYAILQNGKPTILVECKSCSENLEKYGSQLFRYFSTTSAKFGILTNGVQYRFYTDLNNANVMDMVPFLVVDLLDLKDSSVAEMKKFCKPNFDQDQIFSRAEELKYSRMIKNYLALMMDDPSDEFVRLVLSQVYEGVKTQKTVEKYRPLVKKTYQAMIDELVKRRLTDALEKEAEAEEKKRAEEEEERANASKIITTEEELEAYYIIRGLLAGTVPVSEVFYRDAQSYFSVLYQDNNRKPICRINLDAEKKHIMIPDEEKNFTRFDIDTLDDIYKYKRKLINVAKLYCE